MSAQIYAAGYFETARSYWRLAAGYWDDAAMVLREAATLARRCDTESGLTALFFQDAKAGALGASALCEVTAKVCDSFAGSMDAARGHQRATKTSPLAAEAVSRRLMAGDSARTTATRRRVIAAWRRAGELIKIADTNSARTEAIIRRTISSWENMAAGQRAMAAQWQDAFAKAEAAAGISPELAPHLDAVLLAAVNAQNMMAKAVAMVQEAAAVKPKRARMSLGVAGSADAAATAGTPSPGVLP